MGKIADVFGRLESFCITIFLYTIGYIQQAASRNVQTFASAQIFWAAGFNGLQILQQIFVADTSDLLNRALFSTLFDVPFLWTTWAGPEVGAAILRTTVWRWGYAIWAIILPISFIPLAVSLFINQRRAKNMGLEVPSPFRGHTVVQVIKNLWFDMDVFGLLLLATAISLILLPLTLAPGASGGWKNPSMIAMLVIGAMCLLVFPAWEMSKRLAPKAFFPPNLFKNKTVVVGTLIAFFYFSRFCSANPRWTSADVFLQWPFICLSSRTSSPTSRLCKGSPLSPPVTSRAFSLSVRPSRRSSCHSSSSTPRIINTTSLSVASSISWGWD